MRVLPILAAAALVAAACGGSSYTSKNDYVKSINKAEASLQKSVSSLGPSLNSSASGAEIATRLDAGSKAMDSAATDFQKISPPPDAKHAHGEIVDGLHKIAGTFRDAAGAARKNDTATMLKTLQQIDTSPGAAEIQKAQNELMAHGYKFANS